MTGPSAPVGGDRYAWFFCNSELFKHATANDVPDQYGHFITSLGGVAEADTTPQDLADVHMVTIENSPGHEDPWALFRSGVATGQCDNEVGNSYYASWPKSATTLEGETNLPAWRSKIVVVMYQNFCVRPDTHWYEPLSTGIASFEYEGTWGDGIPPGTPWGQFGMSVKVLNDELFINDDSYGFQTGVTQSGDHLYVYRCAEEQACEVARAELDGRWVGYDEDDLADTTHWEYLDYTDSWTAFDGTTKAPTTATKAMWTTGSVPIGDSSVVYNANVDKYIYMYMTAGYSPHAAIRTADNPEGPWSDPVDIILPVNCYQRVSTTIFGTGCYQPIPHPEMDHDDKLAFGYYDTNDLEVDGNPQDAVGRLHWATIPYSKLP